MPGSLHHYLELATASFANNTAVTEESGACISYDELNLLSDRLRDRLRAMGVGRGDRVGICMPKSIDSVAAVFGILKSGAAYVPLDSTAPVGRNAFILSDCATKVALVEERFAEPLLKEMDQLDAAPGLLLVAQVGGGIALSNMLDAQEAKHPAPVTVTAQANPDDLAYLLYTSGSTGKPKGVMLSHRNALRFVEWCSATFKPVPGDRFSSHAPFHFDLSILDLFTPVKHGSCLALISEDTGKEPQALATMIAKSGITIWYSTPSILSLLVQYGKLEKHDLQSLRYIFFAGEVFPVVHLKALKNIIPDATYYNLYGPTETNVCTYYRLPSEFPDALDRPFPIGIACEHYQTIVVDDSGAAVEPGEEGELLVAGDGVMQGYWHLPDRSRSAFLTDASGRNWYRTGDIVVERSDGYHYVSRRDRMVKKRGYRVELGEIETCLYRHEEVAEVAAIANMDDEAGVKIVAHICTRSGERYSIVKLKKFCSENLPGYMIPDSFLFHDSLPKTSTDKTDYQKLKNQCN